MSHAGGEEAGSGRWPGLPGHDASSPDLAGDPERVRRLLGDGPGYGMLPRQVSLIGRDADLAELRYLVSQDKARYEHRRMPARVSIAGVAGVGRSALGTAFAYSLADEYTDGALYVNLHYASVADGALDIPQILRGFLLRLGQSPDLLPQSPGLLRDEYVRATDKKRLIVFLDNVRDYQSVQDLVPQSSTCLLIVTSQEELEDIRSLQLEPLSIDTAVELFGKIAPSRDVADPTGQRLLKQVLEACAGLPIAIIVLAARLQRTPGYTLARLVAHLDKYVSMFGAQGSRIEACFRVGYDALTDVQSLLFRRLSVVPGESFDVQMGAFLSGLAREDAWLVLEQLRERRLIQETQDPEYFTMHSLLRRFARKQLGDAEAAEQLTRALSFSCSLAKAADRVIRSLEPLHDRELSADYAELAPEDRDQALDWMEKQHKNLVATVERACEVRQLDIAWQTCRALVEFFEIRGKWESWLQTHAAAERIVPRQSPGYAQVSYGLGRFYSSRHLWNEAIERYRAAIVGFLQQGDQASVGRSLIALGDAYRYSRNWDKAEKCFERSLHILEVARQPRELAIAKRSMAAVHRLRGQFDEGENLCLEAIAILEELHDERWVAATQLSLADIYLDHGDRDAHDLLYECLRVFTIFKDTHWLTLTRRSLADQLREDGDYPKAMEQLVMCHESLRQDQDVQWEGEVLHSMGLVHLAQDEVAPAIVLFGEALAKFRESQDTLWEGRTQVSIGRAAAAAGRPDEAQAAYQAAWPLLVEQGARADLGRLETLMWPRPGELDFKPGPAQG